MGGIKEEIEDEDWEEEPEPRYELSLHYKQGDDFRDCLDEAKGNVSNALELWAERFLFNSMRCRELSRRFKGKDVSADSDVHWIWFDGDKKLLKKLSEEGLIDKVEYE